MSLVIPSKPSNVEFQPGVQPHIDGDLYNICERIREISPKLVIRPSEQEDDSRRFVINELGNDGIERYVFAVDALDARILDRLRYIESVPFEKRFAEAEKLEEKMKAEEKESQLEELYERVGRPMWTELEKTGFIQRNRSYPKVGVKA